MTFKEQKLKRFRKKFVYPDSLCGQEFLVGVTVENLEAFLAETIEECQKEKDDFIFELETYRDGFIRDDAFGDMERAPEYQVIQDCINAVNNKFNGKIEGKEAGC